MSKLLLDTNLLYYAIDKTSAFHLASQRFIDEVDHDLYTTAKNISEFLVATTRGDSPTLTPQQALESVQDFQKIMTVVYPNEKSFSQLRTLIQQYNPKGKKIHDYEIAAIAIAHGITLVATFNSSDFAKITEITLVDPQNL
ncbi:MAG: PIN domain-containing protein [Tunicatimonas sp.]